MVIFHIVERKLNCYSEFSVDIEASTVDLNI